MDVLIEDISQCSIKVYTLEKVLRRKKDSLTQVDFLTEAMKVSLNILFTEFLSLMFDFIASRRKAIFHVLDNTGNMFRCTGTIGRQR